MRWLKYRFDFPIKHHGSFENLPTGTQQDRNVARIPKFGGRKRVAVTHNVDSSEDQQANATPESDGRRRKTPGKVREVATPNVNRKRKEKSPIVPPATKVVQSIDETLPKPSVINGVASNVSTNDNDPEILHTPDVPKLPNKLQLPGKEVTNNCVLKVVKKNLNALKEIAGRKGCGPLDYTQ
ncbi:hypothetical protein K3495_g9250 [Podosphaera aphanis]|nr:hypothetical protein K3495_g9250 [Podosphaera aphanis]